MIKAWRWCGWFALCWCALLAVGMGGQGLGLGAAEAAPRLVLVDGADAGQLHRALEVSLEAWSFEVVDWPRGSGEVDEAGIAERANARYVVWWDEGAQELVVHDATLGESERRELAAMPGEEAEASALALSIKTMLRLSPPSAGGAAGGVGERGLVWLPSARLGPRFGLDGDSATQLRVQAGLALRVAALGGVELGLVGDVGTGTEVAGGNTRGDWAEWSVMATVGRAVAVKGWTVTGQVGGGVSRATLTAQARQEGMDAASVRACGQLSAIGLRALGPVQVGGAIALTARGSEQYFRSNGQPLWKEPSLLLAGLAVVQVEL